MTSRRPARLAATMAIIAAAACGGDSEEAGGDCVGDERGSVSFSAGVQTSLPGGGNAGIGSADMDEDPPYINLLISPATDEQRETARHLEVDDSFTFKGTGYTVAGFCADRVWLDTPDR